MKIAIKFRWLMVLGLLAIFGSSARGANPGQPESLEKLAEEADIIFKGTVVSSRAVDHDGFASRGGYIIQDTEFKIASIIKGKVPGNTLIFRHYDYDGAMFDGTQFYHFESAKTYIVFAKRSETAAVFQQAWMHTRGQMDAGVLLCTNKPATASNIKDIYWSELMAMLKSTDDSDVVYAIYQLDGMSPNRSGLAGVGRWGGVREFDRKAVLAAVHGLLTNRDPKIAQAAIYVIGSRNPYMAVDRSWLPTDENIGGKLYWKDLVAVANSKSNDATRALAILALGLVREPALQQHLEKWLADPAPAVRASAAVLLADFPELVTRERLTVPDILAGLITDPDAKVRQMAVMSLLSLYNKNETIATILRANLNNEDFGPLFLNALAENDPQPYLDALAKAIEQRTKPRNESGGGYTDLIAWDILFKYLQAQPVDQITSGKSDRYLDAMETVDYRQVLPYVYAFYVQRGMTDRAKRFRLRALEADAAKWAVQHPRGGAREDDLPALFNQVDANPSLYRRK
jgi:non-SMC mitotic condensation complex subunit 1